MKSLPFYIPEKGTWAKHPHTVDYGEYPHLHVHTKLFELVQNFWNPFKDIKPIISHLLWRNMAEQRHLLLYSISDRMLAPTHNLQIGLLII